LSLYSAGAAATCMVLTTFQGKLSCACRTWILLLDVDLDDAAVVSTDASQFGLHLPGVLALENQSDQQQDNRRDQPANDRHTDRQDQRDDQGRQGDAVVHPVPDRSFQNSHPARTRLAQRLQVDRHEDRSTDGQRNDGRQRVEQVRHVHETKREAAAGALPERPVLTALAEGLLLVDGGLVEEAVGVHGERRDRLGLVVALLLEALDEAADGDRTNDEERHAEPPRQTGQLDERQEAADDGQSQPGHEVHLHRDQADHHRQQRHGCQVVVPPEAQFEFTETVDDVVRRCRRHDRVDQPHEPAARRTMERNGRIIGLVERRLDGVDDTLAVRNVITRVVMVSQDLHEPPQIFVVLGGLLVAADEDVGWTFALGGQIV